MRPAVVLAVLMALARPAGALAADGGAAPVGAPGEVAKATGAPVEIAVGRQVVVDAKGVVRVSLGDPSVADVEVVGGDEVLLTGLAPGRTTLLLWFHDGRQRTRPIVVKDAGRLAEAKGAAEVLGLDRVLTFHPAGSHVVVEGTLGRVDQLRRFDQLRAALPDLVVLVRVDPALYRRLAEAITRALHQAGLEGAHATAVGTTVFLEGTVTDPAEAKQAGEIARAIWRGIETGRLETR